MLDCLGKPIVYMVTYLPNVEISTPPYFYIGSSFRWKSNYYGSVSSKKALWCTNGVSLKQWWKDTRKSSPSDFHIEVLWVGDENTTKETLLEEERFFQDSYQAIESNCYFNNAYANENFHSLHRCKRTHDKISKSLKEYYKTPEGIKRSADVSRRNKLTKSSMMKKRFEDPLNREQVSNRMNELFKSDDFRRQWSKDRIGPRKYKVLYKGKEYSLKELAEMQGVGEGTILHRAKNKNERFNDWKLICLK